MLESSSSQDSFVPEAPSMSSSSWDSSEESTISDSTVTDKTVSTFTKSIDSSECVPQSVTGMSMKGLQHLSGITNDWYI